MSVVEVSERLQPEFARARIFAGARSRIRLLRRHPMAVFGACVILLFIFLAVFAPVVAGHDPYEANGRQALLSPSLDHPMGTDHLGRDVLARLIYGTRISLQVGVMAVFFAGGIGVPLGMIAGYRGGVTDATIMRLADAIIAFPGLILALTLVLILGPSLLNIMLALGIGASPVYARLARGQVLSLKTYEFVIAARAVGASDVRIIVQHIWPNIRASIIVAASLTLGAAVLSEASLGFLGIGVRPPTATWGRMLNDSFRLIYTVPWLSFFPGLAIFLLTLSINLVGDGLRDALDPRLRKGQG